MNLNKPWEKPCPSCLGTGEVFVTSFADSTKLVKNICRACKGARILIDKDLWIETLSEEARFYVFRLKEIIPIFEEVRDILPKVVTVELMVLHKISPSLADRMDAAGCRTKEEWKELTK